jgi:hypothetical protein
MTLEVDYGSYAHRGDEWPSTSRGVFNMIPIEEMEPRHAFNAWCIYTKWFRANASRVTGAPQTEEQARRSHMGRALLRQLVGEPVVFTDDLDETVQSTLAEGPTLDALPPVSTVKVSLESIFDALQETDDIDHPVTRARVMLSTFRNQTD